MSLKKTALSGMVWTTLQQFSVQGINFIVSIILARLLSPEEFGLVGMIGVFIIVGNTLYTSGLTQSLIRTKNPDQLDYSTVFWFNFFGSIFIYLILFLFAPFIADFYDKPILSTIIRIYGLSFIINALSAVQSTRLTKELNFKTQMKISIPATITSAIVGIVLAYNGYGVWSLIYNNLIAVIVVTILLWFHSGWRPSFVFDKVKFNYHFGFGYKMTMAAVLNTVFNNIYIIIIGKLFSATQLGYYTRADNLKAFPVNNISQIVNKVTFPLFAQIQDDDVRLKAMYKRIMEMLVFLVAPVMIFSAVLAEPLFRFMLTAKWLPAVPYFQILCWAAILLPVHLFNLNILEVKGRSDLFFRLELIKKGFIILVVLVSLKFGIYGLLWGQLFTTTASFFINTYYTGKFLAYFTWQQTRDLLPILFLACLAGLGVYFCDYFLSFNHVNDLLRLMIGGFTGMGFYLVICFMTKIGAIKEILLIIKRR